MKQNKPTLIFVGCLISLALFSFIYTIVPIERFVAYAVILGFEAWTLVNKREEDTISEAIWELSSYPLVPWLFGAFTVYGMYMVHPHPAESAAWLGVQGHFFWQAHKNAKEIEVPNDSL